MPVDAPDFVAWTQPINVVVDTPVPTQPGTETAIAEVDREITAETTYQEVVSWTVTTAKIGILREVSMVSDNYAKALFKLEVGGTALFTNKAIQAPLTLPFPDVRLAGATVVKLSCKSSDGTSITVDGSISGKETG